MEILNITSKGQIVGRLEEPMPDMWYLEGRFIPADSEAAQYFAQRASSLDPKSVFEDLSRGIQAEISSPEWDGPPTTVIIICLSEDQLFLRRVLEHDAVEWVRANVPE